MIPLGKRLPTPSSFTAVGRKRSPEVENVPLLVVIEFIGLPRRTKVNRKEIRQRRKARQRKRKRRRLLILGGVGLAVSALFGYLIWTNVRPAAGEEVPVMANALEHVAVGQDPGPLNSDPPASGPHYPQSLDPGFYRTSDSAAQHEHPEGYLLHNLEHGYIIFWYNCELLEEAECETLMGNIQSVLDSYPGKKLIAFPWMSTEHPLVLTSWGRKQAFESFDLDRVERFIRRNHNQAPEPNAP